MDKYWIQRNKKTFRASVNHANIYIPIPQNIEIQERISWSSCRNHECDVNEWKTHRISGFSRRLSCLESVCARKTLKLYEQ